LRLSPFVQNFYNRGCSKRSVQQGRRAVGARSVHGVREHDDGPRTPLAAFFNSPIKKRHHFLGTVRGSVFGTMASLPITSFFKEAELIVWSSGLCQDQGHSLVGLVCHNLFTAVTFLLQNHQRRYLLIFIARTLPKTNIEKTQKMYTILDKPPWWNQKILFITDPFVRNPTKLSRMLKKGVSLR